MPLKMQDSAELISLLVNGVLKGEEHVYAKRWSAQFRDRCNSDAAETDPCSVCAFIERCGVIDKQLELEVKQMDRFLHAVCTHYPITLSILGVLVGALLEIYTRYTDEDLDTAYLQLGDIACHYMFSPRCSQYLIVALRKTCSVVKNRKRKRGQQLKSIVEDMASGSNDAEESKKTANITDDESCTVLDIPQSVMKGVHPDLSRYVDTGLIVNCGPSDKYSHLNDLYTGLVEINEEDIAKSASPFSVFQSETLELMKTLG